VLQQRPVLAAHRVGFGEWHARDVFECHRAFGVFAAQQVPGRARRIAADHDQVAAIAEPLVAGARRQHDDVAGLQIEVLAPLAAEPHAHLPVCDAEHLVRGRMIMVERKNSGAPLRRPVARGEQPLDLRRPVAAGIERAAIDQHRQLRIIRDRAVVGEAEGFRRAHFLAENVPMQSPAGPRTMKFA
jgi:hypothetical protein